MAISVLTAACAFSAPEWGHSDHWAVLVAGSSGYGNYRHQADVCHAYQLLKRSGIPEKQIITLAVDDIASSRENPFPGQMFNAPTAQGVAGTDVYAGCKIDYSGKKVTPSTFKKVLTGDASGLDGGKVLKSTSASHVFVNFVDHGGVDLIGFPETTMHATELVGALQTMHDAGMYKQLVFYLEACESGSMFATLPTNLNIYATTAANAKESSWGTYCMPDDKVDGKHVGSCLGDLYSVNWMQDADRAIKGETLTTQFAAVKKLTNKSHVMQFGDTTIASETIVTFEGDGKPAAATTELPAVAVAAASSQLPSTDAALSSAFHRFLSTGSDAAADELMRGVKSRQLAARRFDAIALKIAGVAAAALPPHEGRYDHGCHYQAYKAYIGACGEWEAQAYAHSATLASLCVKTAGDATAIVGAIGQACAAVTVEGAAP